jgi:Flp pilus assembly protein TadG
MAASMKHWTRCRRGLAGLEFALLAPILLTLFAGTVDVSSALLTYRRMGIAAAAVAEIASTGSAQSQALNLLTDVQAWQATTAPFVWFPQWTDAAAQGTFAISVSLVTFTATPAGCAQNCGYVATVAWSVANNLGAVQLRPCGTLTMVPNGSTPSLTTLPAGDFGPTSLLVADISYTFRPLFLGFLVGDIALMRSSYFSPRIKNDVELVPPGGGGGVSVNCSTTS